VVTNGETRLDGTKNHPYRKRKEYEQLDKTKRKHFSISSQSVSYRTIYIPIKKTDYSADE
jgi:hypothetical protein